jgi:hypothetical protein
VRPRRFIITILFGGLAFGSFFAIGGCGDDESKTTGTQLQISPAVKEELDDMKSVQKEQRAERKKERDAAKGKRK